MKQFLLVLMFALMGTGTASAQTEVKDTYVHSEQGFKWRIGSFKTDKKKHRFDGLYSKDGKVLVRIGNPNTALSMGIWVAPGTETIGANAFNVKFGGIVYLPNTVKNLSMYAFTNQDNEVRVYDVDTVTEFEDE